MHLFHTHLATFLHIFTAFGFFSRPYITKPFSLAALRARINAQLRYGAPAQTASVELDAFSFNFEWIELRKNGQLIELSKTEQRLLRVLVKN